MGNKLAVITGGANGIGLALVKECILEGMDVVIVDIAESTLNEQIVQLQQLASTEIVGMICDVTAREKVLNVAKQIIERFGRVDLLINNAGISGPVAPFWEVSDENIQGVLDVNLYGVIHCLKAFLPFMFAQTYRSQIVNMASLYGLCSSSQMAAYGMSKHAIVALSESLYFDCKRLQKPVDISVVCPSFTDTNFLQNSEPLDDAVNHQMFYPLMTRGRSAEDLAAFIMDDIKNKTFYILPDKEVKIYCKERTDAIVNQEMPHQHGVEKFFNALGKRNGARKSL